ncbi:hypothetical protein M9434_006635 [Picochlorum sp. BPE23]|nr:hypothetical protein M9434_006635 [Picochlorum sp. BPE23]
MSQVDRGFQRRVYQLQIPKYFVICFYHSSANRCIHSIRIYNLKTSIFEKEEPLKSRDATASFKQSLLRSEIRRQS